MSQTLERPKRTYGPKEVELALQASAALGSALKASEQTGIPHSTILDWQRAKHRDRWLEIREKVADKAHAQVAAQIEDMLLDIGDAKKEALDRFRSEIGNLAGKDASAAVKNLAIAEANGIDKVLLLRGKPTHISEHRAPEEIIRKLAAGSVVDVEHEEIQDAEVAA